MWLCLAAFEVTTLWRYRVERRRREVREGNFLTFELKNGEFWCILRLLNLLLIGLASRYFGQQPSWGKGEGDRPLVPPWVRPCLLQLHTLLLVIVAENCSAGSL